MIGPMPAPGVYVDPSDAVNTLRILQKKGATLRTPLTQVKNLMVADNVKNFESGGSLYGGWPAASPETKLGRDLMVKTGALKKSLAAKGRKGSGGATGVKGTTAFAGTGVTSTTGKRAYPYPRFHQSGASAGSRKGNLPKREVVGITDKTREKSLTILQKYLASK